MRRSLIAVGLVAVGAVCAFYFIDWSKRERRSLVTASGKILLADNKPIGSGFRVGFWPQENPKAFLQLYTYLPFALTDENGAFEMLLDPSKPKGIPPGKYRVTIIAADPMERDKFKEYQSDLTTPWEVLIPEDGKKDIMLKIGSK